MTSFLRQLFRDKVTAIMLLTSSMIIAICALAPAMFVIIVLNKYLASGVLATLVSLAIGAILLLAFEFAFRQNRAGMIQQFNVKIFTPLLQAYAKKIKEKPITGDQFKKLEIAGATIKGATSSSITGYILDWPFVLGFLIVLLYINWTAAIIAAIFMIIMMILTAQRMNLHLKSDSTANLEIFLMGLMTVVIISVGAVQIIAGILDVGLLIGSNILAARALQGANKYAKAKEAIARRETATAEIIDFIKQ
jgi:ATP-binding cassette subfamily C protein LapB